MAPSADSASAAFNRSGQWSDAVRKEPLKALAAAAAIGFIFGGGASTRLGYTAATIFGRVVLREATLKLVTGLVGTNDGNGGRYRDNRR